MRAQHGGKRIATRSPRHGGKRVAPQPPQHGDRRTHHDYRGGDKRVDRDRRSKRKRKHALNMEFYTTYETPFIGELFLASNGEELIGCWFDNDRFFGYGADGEFERRDNLSVFAQTRDWLDRYFAGKVPLPQELPLAPRGSSFQLEVWSILREIPYGKTITYGDIAKRIAVNNGKRMSAQAVGGAVGRNPLCIIVPCHRVMGAKGNLTGFGGGLDTKIKLLEHEGADVNSLIRPKKGTALEGLPGAAKRALGNA